jgi:hypothetical protein
MHFIELGITPQDLSCLNYLWFLLIIGSCVGKIKFIAVSMYSSMGLFGY